MTINTIYIVITIMLIMFMNIHLINIIYWEARGMRRIYMCDKNKEDQKEQNPHLSSGKSTHNAKEKKRKNQK